VTDGGRVVWIEKRFLPDDPEGRELFVAAIAFISDAIKPGRPRNEDRTVRRLIEEGRRLSAEREAAACGRSEDYGT
jgi:hypothetical protein